ncbi:MAG: hypothetical protein ACOX3E_00575 [Desulfomonilia bacterium]|jgi:hypothetical protein|uniref:Uncharacterized protein n=1 Tax=anaerobic digester metagenome TaxID=1263854 RepID=A0A485M5M8_9ZZZZ|nr:hypothetical protein [Pseudomonadota bacterium]HON38206.1 hypothetical protein [Deltaproteobacteria bacterium]HRS56056.1 hypothetical protein [Desulfomonilia bacterium]HPD21562.1 hypothetical protein [Deltaproteobacteria bacterium]HPX19717.1 hypothetical protein [Deltaproteobacteria bacterium]
MFYEKGLLGLEQISSAGRDSLPAVTDGKPFETGIDDEGFAVGKVEEDRKGLCAQIVP